MRLSSASKVKVAVVALGYQVSFTLEKLVLKLASEINAEISTFSSIHNEKLSKVIKVLDQHTTYRGTAIPFLARVDCKIKISNANFTRQ
jgi:hypothetical protein